MINVIELLITQCLGIKQLTPVECEGHTTETARVPLGATSLNSYYGLLLHG